MISLSVAMRLCVLRRRIVNNKGEQPAHRSTNHQISKRENDPCTHVLRGLRAARGASTARPSGDVVTSAARIVAVSLSDVEALVLDPLAAVAVGVLEAEVVVVAELLRENVICNSC